MEKENLPKSQWNFTGVYLKSSVFLASKDLQVENVGLVMLQLGL